MRGLLGRLCGRAQASPQQARHSPLKLVAVTGDMEEGSHVRFQDSDLDALDNPAFDSRMEDIEPNNNVVEPLEAPEMEEQDERYISKEELYAQVCGDLGQPTKSVKRVHYKDQVEEVPKPAVRRRKRRERDSSRRGRMQEERSEEEGVDWLARGHGDPREVEVLRSMVHKLSLELGREQGRRREVGPVMLEEVEDPAWLTQLGGLVPLLVAYEEELKQIKAGREELRGMVERDQQRLEELLEDNTEMAGQLRDIALTG